MSAVPMAHTETSSRAAASGFETPSMSTKTRTRGRFPPPASAGPPADVRAGSLPPGPRVRPSAPSRIPRRPRIPAHTGSRKAAPCSDRRIGGGAPSKLRSRRPRMPRSWRLRAAPEPHPEPSADRRWKTHHARSLEVEETLTRRGGAAPRRRPSCRAPVQPKAASCRAERRSAFGRRSRSVVQPAGRGDD